MATLENCPTCGNPTSENARVCPACGEPLEAGWADAIREQRRLDEEAAREELRREEEEADRRAAEAALAEKRKKQKERTFWAVAIFVGFAVLGGPYAYDELRLLYVREFRPTEYNRMLAEQKAELERERQRKIQVLEARVANVPASNFEKNIQLYKSLISIDPDNKRYSEKLAYYQQKHKKAEAAKLAAEKAAKAASEAEEKRKGFHCLSTWDGSHTAVKRYVEERMREPDSFEHIETLITPVDEVGNHKLLMKYRARNGFGGMTVGFAIAAVSNADCHATVISIK